MVSLEKTLVTLARGGDGRDRPARVAAAQRFRRSRAAARLLHAAARREGDRAERGAERRSGSTTATPPRASRRAGSSPRANASRPGDESRGRGGAAEPAQAAGAFGGGRAGPGDSRRRRHLDGGRRCGEGCAPASRRRRSTGSSRPSPTSSRPTSAARTACCISGGVSPAPSGWSAISAPTACPSAPSPSRRAGPLLLRAGRSARCAAAAGRLLPRANAGRGL